MHPSSPPARTARPRRRARAAALLVTVVAVGTSSCSLLPFGAGSGAFTQTLADGSGLLVAAPTNFLQEAIVAGPLTLIGEDCVCLESPGGGEISALAFPNGTHPSGDGRAIVLPDGVQVRLGDSIWGGGGYLNLSDARDAFQLWPDAPSGCAGATYLASIYDVKIGTGPTGVAAP